MQQELFQDLKTQSVVQRNLPPLFPHRFLRLRVAYEDLIFGAMALVLVVLGGFCLGVERGKHLTIGAGFSVVQERKVTPQQMAAPEAVQPAAVLTVPTIAPAKQPRTAPSEVEAPYAIQLASYVDSQAAQAEVQRLGRQGYKAQVVKQGKYYELRVSGYRSRTDASVSLATLKKTYRDGFVKRLSS